MRQWSNTTPLTDTAGSFNDATASSLPAYAVRARNAALPARVKWTDVELGLPLSSTGCVAEHPLRMKIAGRSRHILSAPVAWLRDAVPGIRQRLACLEGDSALKRTESLISFARAGRRFAARFAGRNRGITPTIFQVTGIRAEPLFPPAVLRIERLVTHRTLADFLALHGPIIPPIEIEERYCEIAVRRLAQSVLPLDAA